jgi:hypothetical protein
MMDIDKLFRHRPALNPYRWVTATLVLAWLTFVVGASAYTGFNESDEDLANMYSAIRLGAFGIFIAAAAAFGVHWGGKAALAAKNSSVAVAPPTQEEINAEKPILSLEIRGIGLAIDRWHQTSLWRLIKEKKSNVTSIYPTAPEKYRDSASSRGDDSTIASGSAFGYAAGEATAYWPLPVFVLGPPNHRDEDVGRIVSNINSGRNEATLGVTLFLWQDDANTTSGQGTIERLFQFFDDNPDVPAALVFSTDGDPTRSSYRKVGAPRLPDGLYLPNVFDSMVGLLVTRTDRVDRYMRPFAVDVDEDNQNMRTDFGKFWKFYWNSDRKFRKVYEDAERAKGHENSDAPTTMSSAWWHSQLPELWKTLDNRGPGNFIPTPWLPSRWARFQLDEFDAAPLLGYLHRPIKVPLVDEHGVALKKALRVKAIQAGWEQALQTMPESEAPVRVFYDSTDNAEGAVALYQALHGLNIDGHGLDLGDVNEGFDIGKRLGNTGVSSALVELGMGVMASYHDGGVSATVYQGSDGSVSIQMVRPPTTEAKAENQKRWAGDPFMSRVPH